MQIPILLALLEYTLILGLTRYFRTKNTSKVYVANNSQQSSKQIDWVLKADVFTFVISTIYSVIFCMFYWLT